MNAEMSLGKEVASVHRRGAENAERTKIQLVLRFLSYSIFQKLSGFRLKSTAGMTECGGSLYSNIDEFVKPYTRSTKVSGLRNGQKLTVSGINS
jgi:hypothetical protein